MSWERHSTLDKILRMFVIFLHILTIRKQNKADSLKDVKNISTQGYFAYNTLMGFNILYISKLSLLNIMTQSP